MVMDVILSTMEIQAKTCDYLQCSEPPCLADLDGNDIVDAADLGIFLALWNSTNADADFNGDDYVDANDLGLLLVAWGDCP